MAEGSSGSGKRFDENIVRHYKKDGWTYEKTSRMAVYVFLYNKLRGMPKSFGLPNDGISWRYNNYIREHFEELCERFNIANAIPGLDLSKDHYDENGNVIKGGMSTFLEEIEQYSEYATDIGKKVGDYKSDDGRDHVPTDDSMVTFLETAMEVRDKHFEVMRSSVKVEAGYNITKKGENKVGAQIAERKIKQDQISEHKRQIRKELRHTFWHGLGFIASAAVLTVSALSLFTPAAIFAVPASVATGAFGLVGGLVSAPLAFKFGGNIITKLFWFHGAHERMRDLKGQRGKYNERGLNQIEHSIDLNRGVLASYSQFEKMMKTVVYYKRKQKIGDPDLDAGKLLDKDGNIIALSPNNEITGSDGKKYKFDIKNNTISGPLGDPNARVITICPGGVLKDSQNRIITLENVQVPYIESIKKVEPTKEEFIEGLRKIAYGPIDKKLKGDKKKEALANRKNVRTLLESKEYESEFGKLYQRVRERYGYLLGVGKSVRNFVSANKTLVEDNKEIVLEREDFYNSVFNINFDVDAKKPELPPIGLQYNEENVDLTAYPSFVHRKDKVDGDKKQVYNLNISISDFVQALRELRDDAETYKTHHETIKYNQYQKRASEMMPVIIQRELFSRPLTGTVVQMCQNILTNSLVKKTLEEHNNGNITPYVEGIIRFIQAEQVDKENSLITNLGVTVEDQYCTTNAEGMENACSKTLGIDKGGPDWAIIESVASKIANMNEKEMSKSINLEITKITDIRAKEYLAKMLEKRVNEVGYGKNYIYTLLVDGREGSLPSITLKDFEKFAEIVSKIEYNPQSNTFYSGSYSENDIRQMLNRLSNIDGIRPEVEAMLNKQIKSVERGYIDQVRAKAMVAIKNNSVTGPIENGYIKPILDFIEKLDFTKLGTSELRSFFIDNIQKVQPDEVKEYLSMRLRNKIEKIYEERFNTGGLYADDNALKDLSKDLNAVERMQYLLGTARIERIVSGFEQKINYAFENILKIKQTFLFEEGGLDEFNKNLKIYLERPFAAGGFSEFFERNTSSSNEIKNKINAIRNVISISRYLDGKGSGVSHQSDIKVPESKIFLGIYFHKQPRGMNDKLISSIIDVDNFMNEMPIDSFGAGGKDSAGRETKIDLNGAASDYIKKLKMFISGNPETDHLGNPITVPCKLSNVNENVDSKSDALEQMALLLVYKRKVLSLFKAHLKKFTIGRPDIQSFMKTEEGYKYISEIRKLWEPIMQEIDDKYNELKVALDGDEAYQSIVSGFSYIGAMETLKSATNELNIKRYVNSSESVLLNDEPTMS